MVKCHAVAILNGSHLHKTCVSQPPTVFILSFSMTCMSCILKYVRTIP